jgi:hypothetical protein
MEDYLLDEAAPETPASSVYSDEFYDPRLFKKSDTLQPMVLSS